MDNGISREFYPQGVNSNWGQESTKVEQLVASPETTREIGRAAIFSPEKIASAASPEVVEAATDTPEFNEMMARTEAPKFGDIEAIANRQSLEASEVGFSNYTKEFSNADGKIVRAEVKNLENNPSVGYEALQRDRMAYLKSKFNREIK